MDSQEQLRKHVIALLDGRGAHIDFAGVIEGLPPGYHGARPERIPHTPWRLLEHMRICQWDILEYCRSPRHVSPDFPDGYWPEGDAPPSENAWQESVASFQADLQAMKDLVADRSNDLMAPLEHGEPGHTLLREALLLADHNAYHIGQMVIVRRALGAWE